MVRNIVAVVVGYAVWSALWIAAGAAIRVAAPNSIREDATVESTVILLLMLVSSIVISLGSGLCSAMISRFRPFLPVLVLGFALLATGIPIQMAYWDKMPVWYHLSFLVLLVPGVLIGASLRRAPS